MCTLQTIKKKGQAQADLEAIKKDTGRSDNQLQQWVTDVRKWAVDCEYFILPAFSIFVYV